MNQSNRFCKMKGHDLLPAFHICALSECYQPTRWCCSVCISEEIHKHQQPNNSHLMRTKDLILKLYSQSEKIKENLECHKAKETLITLEKIFKNFQVLENSIINYRKSIESQIYNIKQAQAKFYSYQNNLILNKFEQLDDIKLNELININLQYFDQNLQLLPLDDIKYKLFSLESIIIDFEENKNDNSNLVVDVKNRKYITAQIDQTKGDYFGSSISKNEKYMAYGENKILKIYQIKQKKFLKEIKIDGYLYVCQFTEDSSKLFVGLERGYVGGYDVKDNFKEAYKQQIHSNDIYNLITIKNEYLITCSFDQCIIKTDIRSK